MLYRNQTQEGRFAWKLIEGSARPDADFLETPPSHLHANTEIIRY